MHLARDISTCPTEMKRQNYGAWHPLEVDSLLPKGEKRPNGKGKVKVVRIKSLLGTPSLLPHCSLAAFASKDDHCQIIGQIPFLHLLLLKKSYIPGWFLVT